MTSLLDGSALIEEQHVEAAEAVWDHCVETVHRVFGDAQPDHVLPTLLAGLRAAGTEGLTGPNNRISSTVTNRRTDSLRHEHS